MFNRILVVCTGNICRSPVGEALLRERLPERSVESAGLGAVVGEGVHPEALRLAKADGLDVTAHKARQIEPDWLHHADLVLVMSEGQRQAVGARHPEVLGKTMRFGHWLEGGRGRDIPDPYGKSPEVFAQAHALLVEAADAWARQLNR